MLTGVIIYAWLNGSPDTTFIYCFAHRHTHRLIHTHTYTHTNTHTYAQAHKQTLTHTQTCTQVDVNLSKHKSNSCPTLPLPHLFQRPLEAAPAWASVCECCVPEGPHWLCPSAAYSSSAQWESRLLLWTLAEQMKNREGDRERERERERDENQRERERESGRRKIRGWVSA